MRSISHSFGQLVYEAREVKDSDPFLIKDDRRYWGQGLSVFRINPSRLFTNADSSSPYSLHLPTGTNGIPLRYVAEWTRDLNWVGSATQFQYANGSLPVYISPWMVCSRNISWISSVADSFTYRGSGTLCQRFQGI